MRTVIVYHKDGSKSEYSERSGAIEKMHRDEDHFEKIAFHNQVIRGCYEAECDGNLQMSRREANFHKTVHQAAAECGGDLPAYGVTRLGF